MPLVYREISVFAPCPPPNPEGRICETIIGGYVWEDDPFPDLSGADYRDVTVGGINTGVPNYGLPGGPDNIPPDNADWNVWFENQLGVVRALADTMIGSTRGSIPWSPPVEPPHDPPPTDPIDKDEGPDVWPDWLPKPWEAPCQTCGPVTLYPGNPKGGVVVYRSKYGQSSEPLKIQKNGQWIDNPKLAELGINVNGTSCDCASYLTPDDILPPEPDDDPWEYDCKDHINNLVKKFPEVSGCDKLTKLMVAQALLDSCIQMSNNFSNDSSGIINNLYLSNNDNLTSLLNCMMDPNMLASLVKKIECTKLPGDQQMFTKGEEGTIQIDIDKIFNTSSRFGIPIDELMSQAILHELTHLCCAQQKGSCNEVDNYILGLILYGLNSWNSPSNVDIKNICEEENVLKQRKETGLSDDMLPGGNFVISLSTGFVYTVPYTKGDPAIYKLPIPSPNGFDPCPPIK